LALLDRHRYCIDRPVRQQWPLGHGGFIRTVCDTRGSGLLSMAQASVITQ